MWVEKRPAVAAASLKAVWTLSLAHDQSVAEVFIKYGYLATKVLM